LAEKGRERVLAGMAISRKEFISALTVAVFMLVPQIVLLMPLYAALVGATCGEKKRKTERCE